MNADYGKVRAPRRLMGSILCGWLCAVLLGACPGAVATAGAVVMDFTELDAGEVVTAERLEDVYGLQLGGFSVHNDNPNHPQAGIIFDSACPGGCTGGDADLKTPGTGPGNNVAQGKILIIAEDLVDGNINGLVDDPDDECCGGTIELEFRPDKPYKLISMRPVDIDDAAWIEVDRVAGGTLVVPVPVLGDNSAQNLAIAKFENPSPAATAIRLKLDGSGGFDQILVVAACGDAVPDPGEECDPPGISTALGICNSDCKLTAFTCGNDSVDPGEQCDPPASDGGSANCNDDCSLADCGNGTTDAGEQCDPPASAGGAVDCTDDCSFAACGDGTVQAGEECDPPASAGGNASCDDQCLLAPACGNEVLDAGEECDPPNAEACDDGVDGDGDGLVDCGDPDCSAVLQPTCNAQCGLVRCEGIARDPGRIALNEPGDVGQFAFHGRVRLAPDELDPAATAFGVRLHNDDGEIYRGDLAPGELAKHKKRRYRYVDESAHGGEGRRDGLRTVSGRFRKVEGTWYYVFRVKAFGDFSKATLPRMTTQVYAGPCVGFLTADWRPTSTGWRILERDLARE